MTVVIARNRPPPEAVPPAAVVPGGRPRIAVRLAASGWRRLLPDAAARCRRAAAAALAAEAPGLRTAELSILLADDRLLQRLNRDWRGRDRPTNVLSFAADADQPAAAGQEQLLGDVVLAFETCQAEAAAQAKPLAHHLAHLVVHGVLHLLGHDHEQAGEARRMEGCEREILGRLGIPDPYRPADPAAAGDRDLRP